MKKSLLALAVLGAFTGVASAQSSVTVYGIVDTSIYSEDTGSERTTGIESGKNAASRIGFRGTEDLGGGMNAHFLLESGIRSDTGRLSTDNTLFNRLSYVGLQGSLGTIRAGRQNAPIKTAMDAIDPFANAGHLGSVDAMGYVPGIGNLYPERVSNMLLYATPKMGGFSGSAAYVFGETAGDTSANNAYGFQGGYANGPLNVQLGYDNTNTTDVGVDIDVKNTFFGATYDFGTVKLHAAAAQTKVDVNLLSDSLKVRNYLLGVTVPFGNSKIRASYIRNQVRDFDDSDSDQLALSYSYAMSKRTSFYVSYAHVSNDDFADLTVDTAGATGSRVAIGIQHNF